MSSFYPRRNVDNRGGWFPSIFGMNPFNMMSSRMSDIYDPINRDIDQLLDRSLHWIDLPTTSKRSQSQQSQQTRQRQQMTRQQQMQQQQHGEQSLPKQKHQQQMHQQMHGSGITQQKILKEKQQQQQCKMPQKFRILIDCSCCDPKTLKTHIKTVNDQKHLIVCADEQKIKKQQKISQKGIDTSCTTTKFKRTYTLPKQCDVSKMISFVTPNGQFVVEFPLQEVVCCVDIDLVPKIEKTPEGRCVSLRVPIPPSVDPSKVKLTVKGCECILRFEERFGTEDCVSRVYFYNRCKLPDSADLNKIKCCADKHRLIITAPLRTDTKTWQSRDIPIQRKIRHKALLHGDEQKMGKSISTSQQQKKKNVSTSRSKSPITSEQRKSSIKSGSEQKQKSPSKTEQQKQKSPTKDTDKKKKNKSTTEAGSDILKSVFGSSSQSDKDKDKNKKNKSSSGDVKSDFPSLPSDNKQSSEGHHQQQQ